MNDDLSLTSTQDGHLLISVATYRRPLLLRRLLRSLLERGAPDDVDILVVDNDASGSAREVVGEFGDRVRYTIESDPGIASARNAGLAAFDERYAAIIFVDDDEWVESEWWPRLREARRAWPDEILQGPVHTRMPDDAKPDGLTYTFFQRSATKDGTALRSAATNNAVLPRARWDAAGRPQFDTAFSVSGGSDWDFFWNLRRQGSRIRYVADMVIFEDVPTERLSLRWVRRRALRKGVVHLRVLRKYKEPLLPTLARGVARLGYHAARQVLFLVTGRGLQGPSYNAIFQESGKILAIFGYGIREYVRAPEQ